MTREDKTTFVDNMASKAQEAAERQDMKSLYDITKKLVRRKTDTGKPVKTQDGRTNKSNSLTDGKNTSAKY